MPEGHSWSKYICLSCLEINLIVFIFLLANIIVICFQLSRQNVDFGFCLTKNEQKWKNPNPKTQENSTFFNLKFWQNVKVAVSPTKKARIIWQIRIYLKNWTIKMSSYDWWKWSERLNLIFMMLHDYVFVLFCISFQKTLGLI